MPPNHLSLHPGPSARCLAPSRHPDGERTTSSLQVLEAFWAEEVAFFFLISLPSFLSQAELESS